MLLSSPTLKPFSNASFLTQFDKDEMASDSRLSWLQRRDEMLLLSERCFTSALGIEDGEAWLHHYMLGKISEKLKKRTGVYLEHYQQVRISMTTRARARWWLKFFKIFSWFKYNFQLRANGSSLASLKEEVLLLIYFKTL